MSASPDPSTDHPDAPEEVHHMVRMFPIDGGARHVASCSCGRTSTSADPAEAMRTLVFDGCLKSTPRIEPSAPED